MERAARLQGHFYLSLKFLIKISLNKKFFPSVKRPRKGASLHVSQKRGTCGNIRPFLKPYLACLSESPVKERSLQVHSYSSFGERCPIPRALLHSSFKVPGIRASFQVSQRGPYWERCPSPEPSSCITNCEISLASGWQSCVTETTLTFF